MRIILTIILVLALAVLTGKAFAADYSQYTTEELASHEGYHAGCLSRRKGGLQDRVAEKGSKHDTGGETEVYGQTG
jgi:hypothetical protein